MSSVHLGSTPLKIDSETVFDPRYGFQTRETYTGPVQSITTLNATLVALGIRTNQSQQAGRTYLQVFWGLQDPSGLIAESPTDYYELDSEYVQESVWKNDLIEKLAGSLTTLGSWRREIESAMKGRLLDSNGNESSKVEGPLPPPIFSNVNLEALYELFLRDGDAYETTRQVLTRVRTISIAYSAQAVAQVRPTIYTTQQLVTVFGIPATIQARLPADPLEIPSNTLWSWKQRRNISRYEWNGRVSEVMSWTFAAWSTLTHQLYTGG